MNKHAQTNNKCTVANELLKNLYNNQSPYATADLQYVDESYPDTHIQEDLIELLFKMLPPNYIVECGSMLGGSIITFAEICQRLNIETNMICIDPFTGDLNMWDWEKGDRAYKYLKLENGIPTIYKRFLANICKHKYQDIIMPINCTTTVGIKLLHRLHEQKRISSLPNYIYLDSAHELYETYVELIYCWGLLEENSILFGDDWRWSAINQDVNRLSNEIEINKTFLNKVHSELKGSTIENNILLYKDHWVLFK